MKKNYLLKWIPLLMLVFLLQACGAAQQSGGDDKNKEPKENSDSYTVVDDLGEEITFEKAPEKIISLSPSVTEMLYALGVGDKLIGVTSYDNYPEEVKEVEAVSDLMNINAEKIISLKPDLVFVSTIGDKTPVDTMKEAGVKVFVIDDAMSFEDVYGHIGRVAKVMDVEDNGEKLVNQIKGDINVIEEKLANVDEKKQVYLEISPSPDIVTSGNNTFQNEVLKTAGVENVFADKDGWFKVSEEDVLKQNPEVIITHVNFLDDSVGEIKGRLGWDKMDAVKNDQVYEFDTNLMSRPGPRIAEAAELVAKTLYPELFE